MCDQAIRIQKNFATFNKIVDKASDCVRSACLEAAAAYAQVAAQYGTMNHTGQFASLKLERLLAQIGSKLALPVQAPPNVRPHVILHVTTQAYQTGGHTQAISCWLERDKEHRHIVCVTHQKTNRVPAKILDHLESRNDLVLLSEDSRSQLGRAMQLRKLAAYADIVVLHTHPWDIIPVMAFSGKNNLPIVYINHADHVFWLGASIATLVVNLRESGQHVSKLRRGIENNRSKIMGRPLRHIGRNLSRKDAKEKIGIDPKLIVITTTACASKFSIIWRPSFFDLVSPILQQWKNVILLAAGPRNDAHWSAASDECEHRIRALGPLPDVSVLHQATDIYIDSFPFSSLTSLIEAGSFGVPVVTFRGHPEECAILGSDSPGLDDYIFRPDNELIFQNLMNRLIVDSEFREAAGRNLAEAIIRTHQADVWLSSLRLLLDDAFNVTARPQPLDVFMQISELDLRVEAFMAHNPFNSKLQGAIQNNFDLFPLQYKLSLLTEFPNLFYTFAKGLLNFNK